MPTSKTIIIGAGPVGLWTAIQVKLRAPDTNVIVYEKRESYTRTHTVKVKHFSFVWCADNRNHPAVERIHKKLFNVSPLSKAVSCSLLGTKTSIPIQKVEEELSACAKVLGIDIRYQEVISADRVERDNPDCSIFVAADGSRSPLRTEVFGKDCLTCETLHYCVEVKAKAGSEVSALSGFNTHRLNAKSRYFVSELVKGRDVCLRFFVPKKVFEVGNLQAHLAPEVSAYSDLQGVKLDGISVSKFEIPIYSADRFATRHGPAAWFLVGDAAMGLPYFRSMNSGIIVGSQLGIILSKDIANDAKILAYNSVKPLDAAWEYTGANLRNTALKIYDKTRALL